jgi:hypothetical protein
MEETVKASEVAVNMARLAQAAMSTSGAVYRSSLKADVYALRHEAGLHKMLDYAKEARAKALADMANGTKETFEANRAAWRVWDEVAAMIEFGPRIVDIPDNTPKKKAEPDPA